MSEPTDNRRVKDEHHDHDNSKWGFSKEMDEFVSEIQTRFPGIRITSGKRSSAGHHHTGNAVDIGVRRDTDKDAIRMYNWLMNDPEGLSLMKRYGLGIIDETDPNMMKKTGATGPHFHIGKDSKFYQQTVDRLNQYDEYYIFPERENVKYKKQGNQWFINLGESSNNRYVPITDPTGERAAKLEKSANLVIKSAPYAKSFYEQNSKHDYSKPYVSSQTNTVIKNIDPNYKDNLNFIEDVYEPSLIPFTQDLNKEQEKQEIISQKQKTSTARENLMRIQQKAENDRKILLDAISKVGQNTVTASQEDSVAIVPYQQLQQIPLQDQYQLPEIPMLIPIPNIGN